MPLKINVGKAAAPEGSERAPSIPPTPASTTSTGGPRISLKNSVPPTPASEQPPTLPAAAKGKPKKAQQQQQPKQRKPSSKKRNATDSTISPAAKRIAGPQRTLSITLGPRAATNADVAAQGASRISLKRKSTGSKIRSINVKRPPPPRLPGQGYDSEDSEAEADPAIQQAFVLRMQPGEDSDYLHDAIANGRIGVPISEGGAEVSLRFLNDKELRRAVVTVRGRMYAAALVDLPCIVETMKSWDKKGWWKVADMSQMLLVLGRCHNDEEARTYPLPREVDKETMQYAHGLTPPMHWVRKRRFRKRLSYKTIANVDEEVERLIREDVQIEDAGGSVSYEVIDQNRRDRRVESAEYAQEEEFEDPDAMETIENGTQREYFEEDEDDADLEGGLQAMFDAETQDASDSGPIAAELVSDSPVPLADQAPTLSAVTTNLLPTSEADSVPATPAGGDPTTQTEDEADAEGDEEGFESSDEDDDDDEEDEENSPDVMDEDALAKAAERNQQLEEVADLEKEIESQRQKVERMGNALLKQRALAQLRTLEEDLSVKRRVFGLDNDDEDDEGEGEAGPAT